MRKRYFFISNLLPQAAGILLLGILSRLINPKILADIGIFLSWATIVSVIFYLRIDQYLFVIRNKNLLLNYLSKLWLLGNLLLMLIWIVSLGIKPSLSHSLLAVALLTSSLSLYSVSQVFLVSKLQLGVLALIKITQPLIYAFLALALSLHLPSYTLAYVVSLSISYYVASAPATKYIWRSKSRTTIPRMIRLLKKAKIFGKKRIAIVFSSLIHYSMPLAPLTLYPIIGLYSNNPINDTSIASYFLFSSLLAASTSSFRRSIGQILYTNSSLIQDSITDRREYREDIRKRLRIVLFIIAALALFIFFYNSQATQKTLVDMLFGRKYVDDLYLFRLCALYYIIDGILEPFSGLLEIWNIPRLLTISESSKAFLCLLVVPSLVKLCGLSFDATITLFSAAMIFGMLLPPVGAYLHFKQKLGCPA